MKLRVAASLAFALSTLVPAASTAAPFASGVRNTSGSTYEFVLNEAADSVVITRDGGNALDLGALGAGRHTFDLSGFNSFDITVSRNASPGFTAIDDSANLFTSFERPGGLAINNIPSSPYFGTIYVNQNRSQNDAGNPILTGAGREMGNGVYALTADRLGVDLTNFSVPANANDPSLAKAPGISIDPISSSSMYRMGMDDAGNLVLADWSDTFGGIKWISADLSTGGPLLRTEFGPTGGVESDDSDEFGPLPLHGSVNGEPQVSGVVGQNLVVQAMDEDLDVDLQVTTANDGNSIWRWNVGNAAPDPVTGAINFAGAPELVAAVGDFYTVNGADRATSGVNCLINGDPCGTHSDGSQVFLASNIGVTANAQYNAQFDKWYVSGARFNGDDSSSLVIFTPEGPGGDGRDIQVDWASKQFTIDNGLDGFTDDPEVAVTLDPHNDIFRNTHNVTFSPDGSTMYLHRRGVLGDNPVIGFGTDLGERILAIPLDENGLPDIVIDDNGTPDDTSDDFFANVTAIATSSNAGFGASFSQVKVDAIGNLYYSGNQSERLEYFSLGGNSVATYSNVATLDAGTFDFMFLEPIVGDYNGDGLVDAADYTVWRDTLGSSSDLRADGNGNGVIDPADYDTWVGAYGEGGSSTAAVPEPSAVVLSVLAVAGLAGRRRAARV
ncbi:hypothetical protein [Botrimarina sp.]|uniref:hypothetical protein n=1 Tax=Botrimarina sp. TaxID=2795802 RepID=UPI0032EB1336